MVEERRTSEHSERPRDDPRRHPHRPGRRADRRSSSDEPPIARDYRTAHVHPGLVDLLAENLADYRAHVHRTSPAELPDVIARLLAEHGARGVAVPNDLPEEWLAAPAQPASS